MSKSPIRFEAKTVFNDETIRKMFRAEYFAYERLRMLFRVGLGALLLITGLFFISWLPLRSILMLFGCWFIVSTDFPSRMRAERVLAGRNGQSSTVCYRFTDDAILIEQNSGQILYRELDRLILDRQYFYLFESRRNAVMVARNNWSMEGQKRFAEFLSEKSGKEWGQNKSILTLNLKDVRKMLKDHFHA